MAFPNWIDQVNEADLDAQIEQAIARSEAEYLTQSSARCKHSFYRNHHDR